MRGALTLTSEGSMASLVALKSRSVFSWSGWTAPLTNLRACRRMTIFSDDFGPY